MYRAQLSLLVIFARLHFAIYLIRLIITRGAINAVAERIRRFLGLNSRGLVVYLICELLTRI